MPTLLFSSIVSGVSTGFQPDGATAFPIGAVNEPFVKLCADNVLAASNETAATAVRKRRLRP